VGPAIPPPMINAFMKLPLVYCLIVKQVWTRGILNVK